MASAFFVARQRWDRLPGVAAAVLVFSPGIALAIGWVVVILQ
ncbi:hypothetical protein NYP18_02350 [Corynebacterium sp. YIM 101645]|uniref:Uncharacterized protein n=1 Tax=Corynebacterium lemuris TaxID=1859292 RepID=A0ABT2FVH2_9CORY|nr:hypothetical protein [Corynebacterium lemuris]MCS5478488.1 hypothetical protein [Corynebacterium lemuris]